MPEIGTNGSMGGDGKRSVAAWPKLPRPSSTLPEVPGGQSSTLPEVPGGHVGFHGEYWRVTGRQPIVLGIGVSKGHSAWSVPIIVQYSPAVRIGFA